MTVENITPGADGRLTGQLTLNSHTLDAYYNLDRIRQDQNLQKILAILTAYPGGTDRSHIQKYTQIPDQTLGWRIKELREAGLITETGECQSIHNRRATRLSLTTLTNPT